MTLLLCPPDHYGIEYEINPWMRRSRNAEPGLARAQWQGLCDGLKGLGCGIEIVPPQPGLPDMVFTANAGLVVGRRFIRSNFRHKERRGEAEHFERWFAEHDFEIVTLPPELFFEGEGDALYCRDVLFCGYRFRSDIRSHQRLAELLGCLAISVELVDERFYHLDTCFCPLPDGGALWFPAAFDEYGQRAIREHCGPLSEVQPAEAVHFACNAVVVGQVMVLPEGCPRLTAHLAERGYRCHALPMTEFIKAGGACKCLTLYLPADAPGDSRGRHQESKEQRLGISA
jgi:N-dimethylarginine dimethylaminohydrolase